MARPWRLRHKLTLLLGLVLLAVGSLLGGTVYGLSGYRATADVTKGKVAELQLVHLLQAAVAGITAPPAGDAEPAGLPRAAVDRERDQARGAIDRARVVLDQYRRVLAANAAGAGGEEADEHALVGRIGGGLDRLDGLVGPATAGGSVSGGGEVRLIGPHTPAGAAHADLARQVTDLHGYLTDDIFRAIDRAKGRHDRSLVAAGAATAVASVLLATLLYYFRVWVFSPVRQLQAGVRRVRAGEFDRPIRLTSDDELAELGAEFDAMTARLAEVNADLRRQVNERTKQLVRSEKMVSVGFLAAGVAHEINNPLASIAFCAEALEGRLTALLARAPAAESEVVLKYLRMVQDEAQRCKQITQKLLDFSRSGGRREPADLAQLVQDVVEVAELTPTARGKAIEFAPAGPVTAAVSVPDVKGVVLNLIVNALDSMDEGGRLTVRLGVRGEFAELAFADTGCGMTPETLDNIFEPFFTRSRTGQGTGLGLSISHQIIDQHGGTVAAASPGPGKGSTFTVRLPLRSRGQGSGVRGQDDPPTLPFPGRQTAAA